jgi:hypothetical protein
VVPDLDLATQINADPDRDTDPKPCLLRPGARHHRIVRVDAEVGAVLRETDRRVVEDVRGLRTRQDARGGARLEVDAVLFRAGKVTKIILQIANFLYSAIIFTSFCATFRHKTSFLDSVADSDQHPDPDPQFRIILLI